MDRWRVVRGWGARCVPNAVSNRQVYLQPLSFLAPLPEPLLRRVRLWGLRRAHAVCANVFLILRRLPPPDAGEESEGDKKAKRSLAEVAKKQGEGRE